MATNPWNTSNPLAIWNQAGGQFQGRTGADVWANPNTAATPQQANFTGAFNYQNPLYLSDAEGAMMRSGQKFKTAWQEQEVNPNTDPLFQQWASSQDRFGGMWNPTDQADIAAGQGADINTAFRNWKNAYAQANPQAYQQYMQDTGQAQAAPEFVPPAGYTGTPGNLKPVEPNQQGAPVNPYMPNQQGQQPYQVNPYLAQQAAGMATSAITDFQRQIAPGIRSGAMAAGGYGGSRQGIAEGIAVGDLQRNILNATSKLFGDAYEGDQNRQTTRYASDNSLRGSMYGADRGLEGTKYTADKSERVAGMQDATNRYLGAMQNQTTQRGQDVTRELGLGNINLNRYLGDQSNATTRRGQDVTLGLGQMNDATNRYLGNMNNETTRRGQDLNYSLGTDRLALDRRIGDQNYGINLGNMGINQQNANTNANRAANDLFLGQGNLNLGWANNSVNQQNANTNLLNANNNMSLGLGNLALGQGNLALSNRVADNNFTLGQGNLNLGWANNANAQANTAIAQANAGTNAASAGANMTNNAISTATNMLGALYQMGITDMNNPLMQVLLPYINSLIGTATGGTSTTTRP